MYAFWVCPHFCEDIFGACHIVHDTIIDTIGKCRFCIGPEGGFSDTEVAAAGQAGFVNWSVGPRILRTETAPVVALSLLQRFWGDF